MNQLDFKSYDYNQKKKFVYRIQNLKKRKFYIKLFKLIIEESIEYSTNNNGVFVNISKINSASLKKIENFLEKCENSVSIEYCTSDSNDSMSEHSLSVKFS